MLPLLLFLLFAPAWNDDAVAAFAEANAHFEARRNEEALAAYDRAIALDPKQADYHVGRCRTLARLSRHDEAVPACSEALRLRPDDPVALRWRGHFHISLRQFDRAVADLARAAELRVQRDAAPENLDRDIFYHLALAHYLRGDFDQAAAGFQRCLQMAVTDDDTVACVAWLYPSLLRAGRQDQAARVLAHISPQLDVKENTAYLDRLLLFKGKRTEQQVAAAMEGDTPEAALSVATVAYGIGLWHLLNERRDPARRYFERAVQEGLRAAFGRIAAEAELARLR